MKEAELTSWEAPTQLGIPTHDRFSIWVGVHNRHLLDDATIAFRTSIDRFEEYPLMRKTRSDTFPLHSVTTILALILDHRVSLISKSSRSVWTG